MLKFTSFLIEASDKNLHMEHVDDLIFNKGLAGAKDIFAFMESLRDMLAGKAKSKMVATVKYDGAPAIFAGIDPADGKFFVAKKGLFNVKPKLYKTQADIDADLSGELADRFSIALREFAKLGIKSGVYQGDLMFVSETLKKVTIDGEEYLTFHPNTIVYAVPYASALARRIREAKIGVVWHTTYTGNSIANMKASFGKSIVSKMNDVSSVWMDDATFKDVSGSATMTAKETKDIDAVLAKAKTILKTIPPELLKSISTNEELLMRVKTYNNTKIRAGEAITDTKNHSRGLLKYLDDYFTKEEASKKTETGKSSVRERKKMTIAPIVNHIGELHKVYDFYNVIVAAKNLIVSKMNQASSLGTFIRTASGYKVTTPEGYVAIDHLTGGAVKLVDRLEFSKANFSKDVIKGWTK